MLDKGFNLKNPLNVRNCSRLQCLITTMGHVGLMGDLIPTLLGLLGQITLPDSINYYISFSITSLMFIVPYPYILLK